MSKRRRRRARGSKQPPQRQNLSARGSNPKLKIPPQQNQTPQFTSAELAFFAAGELVHETHVEYEPERPSLWRRLVARITLDV